MANYTEDVVVTAGASATAGLQLRRGATGRSISLLTKEQGEEDARVLEWFQSETEEEFVSNSTHAAVAKELSSAPQAQFPIIGYRGRWLPETMKKFDPFDFGPPPPERTPVGRYNCAGQPTLYLATTLAGVRSEMTVQIATGCQLLCQRFVINEAHMRIADLTVKALANVVHLAFDHCETLKDPATYYQSQRLRRIVEALGFEGMLVPGVRGSPENRYDNLVVFSPRDFWRVWVETGSVPEQVRC